MFLRSSESSVNASTRDRYLRWLQSRSQFRGRSGTLTADSYLFDEPRVRFEIQPTDLVMAAPGALAVGEPGQLGITFRNGSRHQALRAVNHLGVPARRLQSLLALLDGTRSFSTLQQPPFSPVLIDALREDALGTWIFIPWAVAECEAAIPAAEITRFPGSPYEIDRGYWQNMGAVRRRLKTWESSLREAPLFVNLLSELHQLTLLGADTATFYQPASRISRETVEPGRFFSGVGQLRDTTNGTIIESGLRVGVPAVGGVYYHQLLYRSLGDPTAAEPRRHFGPQGVPWGRCVIGRTGSETNNRAWFCPPRPILPAHLTQLRAHLKTALEPSKNYSMSLRLARLANFHQRFVQLHPFACANQSIAMNMVNCGLNQLIGVGLPHLILDQLALRLSPTAYEKAFSRAVTAYAERGLTAVERHRGLAQARVKAFALSAKLQQSPDLKQAAKLAAASGTDQELLLLCEQ